MLDLTYYVGIYINIVRNLQDIILQEPFKLVMDLHLLQVCKTAEKKWLCFLQYASKISFKFTFQWQQVEDGITLTYISPESFSISPFIETQYFYRKSERYQKTVSGFCHRT